MLRYTKAVIFQSTKRLDTDLHISKSTSEPGHELVKVTAVNRHDLFFSLVKIQASLKTNSQGILSTVLDMDFVEMLFSVKYKQRREYEYHCTVRIHSL